AILNTGTLITTGDVQEVLMDEDVVEVSAENMQLLAQALSGFNHHASIHQNENNILITLPKGTARLDEINSFCFNQGITLNHLLLKKKRLEARFFELTNN
ncbi:MAG TPA: hypothetical protein VNS32_22315, partial [Flavisolibacter sp.]|nr:hypothetical protein [Flavisolibacter sp.]